jgi:hypothetical protein
MMFDSNPVGRTVSQSRCGDLLHSRSPATPSLYITPNFVSQMTWLPFKYVTYTRGPSIRETHRVCLP